MNNIKRFDSPEALGAWLKAIPTSDHENYDVHFGGEYLPQAINILESGDLRYVADAEKVMNKLADANIMSTGLKTLQADVVGFMPLIPNVLAGLPNCMLARSETEIEATNTPLCIYIDTTVSASLSYMGLINRGVATLAFTLAMANIRPIELYTVSTCTTPSRMNDCYGVVTRIETKPLDIARAAWMLCAPAMARRIMHTSVQHLSQTRVLSAPFSWGMAANSNEYQKNMRGMLNLAPHDVFITGGYITDRLMLSDPVAWVKQMIDKHTQGLET